MSDDVVRCNDFAVISSMETFSTRYKRVTKTFHKNQRLTIGNQYHKDATNVTPRIIEKFEEPYNIITHQIDETLKERQMKYPKIVDVLGRILYLIGKQGISDRRTQETAANSDIL